jgi:hypothetical protein
MTQQPAQPANQAAQPTGPVVPAARSQGIMALLLGAGAVLYVLLAAGCALYLLWNAYNLPAVERLSDFNKLAISALIAVVGTGLTRLAAVDSATRQSATAFQFQIALYNGEIAADLALMKQSADAELALMKGNIDAALAQLKGNSDESLARLKVALDAGQNANRELFGTASIYFYAVRSIALGKWDEESLKKSETAMIAATRHLINVDEELRDQWFDFWQRAQQIYRTAAQEADDDARSKLVRNLMGDKVPSGSTRLDLRDLHSQLERTAKSALKIAQER